MGCFYNKEIEIYIYCDIEYEHGVSRKGYNLLPTTEPTLVDIQPYSSEKAKKEYGYNIKTTKRMFCDIIPEITESAVIKYQEQYYGVQKVVGWDDYLDVMLLERYDIA
jgi:hypothetical protein